MNRCLREMYVEKRGVGEVTVRHLFQSRKRIKEDVQEKKEKKRKRGVKEKEKEENPCSKCLFTLILFVWYASQKTVLRYGVKRFYSNSRNVYLGAKHTHVTGKDIKGN
ncbi:hypothetical protein CEXT_312431 [Caerostris extrusa]|uniref:Uncharacterized protein n=1 Tax=Caerostris extrusa TaxID=172846 RepID=A0AAV4VM65_CAEEX|nr:hypothetical protein CEXT_312431 [Caerostris extrusa]